MKIEVSKYWISDLLRWFSHVYFQMDLLPWYQKNKHYFLIKRSISRKLSNAAHVNKVYIPQWSAPIPNNQRSCTETQWYAYHGYSLFNQYKCQGIFSQFSLVCILCFPLYIYTTWSNLFKYSRLFTLHQTVQQ